MRVVGYVREAAAEGDGEPAFTQGERLRAWSRESGHRLVAVFQDTRQPGVELGWDGYRAMLDLVDGDRVDAVLVSSLAALSPDLITQEALVWDLRNRGVAVVSGDPADAAALTLPDPARRLVRDVLERAGEVDRLFAGVPAVPEPGAPQPSSDEEDESDEVIVELIPADREGRAERG